MSGRLVLDVATPPKGQQFPRTTYEPTLWFHFKNQIPAFSLSDALCSLGNLTHHPLVEAEGFFWVTRLQNSPMEVGLP